MAPAGMAISKRSPIPLYYQLAELIRERIHSGELASGEQLPSDRELAEQAQISRMTARQAIAYLVRDGTLVVKPGIGTFVAEPKLTYDAHHLLGFTEETMQHGGAVTTTVLEQEVMVPPPLVAAALGLGPGRRPSRSSASAERARPLSCSAPATSRPGAAPASKRRTWRRNPSTACWSCVTASAPSAPSRRSRRPSPMNTRAASSGWMSARRCSSCGASPTPKMTARRSISRPSTGQTGFASKWKAAATTVPGPRRRRRT